MLKQTSPIHYVDNVQAPMLLIYSKDDTVVNPNQSRVMHKALKKAKKNSKLVALADDDHWFSTNAMRLQVLKEISEFVVLHNPPD